MKKVWTVTVFESGDFTTEVWAVYSNEEDANKYKDELLAGPLNKGEHYLQVSVEENEVLEKFAPEKEEEDLTVEKTPSSIADAIIHVEFNVGESFLEYNDIFSDASNIMYFAHDKGYISEEKFQLWKDCFWKSEEGTKESFQVIFGGEEEYEPFCITHMDEESDKSYNEQYYDALLIYGELVCSNELYYKEFLNKLRS